MEGHGMELSGEKREDVIQRTERTRQWQSLTVGTGFSGNKSEELATTVTETIGVEMSPEVTAGSTDCLGVGVDNIF